MLPDAGAGAGLVSPTWPLPLTLDLPPRSAPRPLVPPHLGMEDAADAAEALVRPWLANGQLSQDHNRPAPPTPAPAPEPPEDRYSRAVQVAWDVAFSELRRRAANEAESQHSDPDMASLEDAVTAARLSTPPTNPISSYRNTQSAPPNFGLDSDVVVHSSNDSGLLFACPTQLLSKSPRQPDLRFWVADQLSQDANAHLDDPDCSDEPTRFENASRFGLTALPPLPSTPSQHLGALGTAPNGSLLVPNPKDRMLPMSAVLSGPSKTGNSNGAVSSVSAKGTNIPPQWRTGILGELAQRADSTTTSTTQGAFLLVEDPNECYTIWTQVWQQWRRENPTAPVVPGDGFGFLRQRRLQNWAQKQRYNHRKGILPSDRQKYLKTIGFFDDHPEAAAPQVLVGPAEKLAKLYQEVAKEIDLAELKRPRGFQIPEAWTTGSLTNDALLHDGRDPTDTSPLHMPLRDAIKVYISFKQSNSSWAPLVPRDGFGFLKNGALYNWLTLQWQRLEEDSVQPDDVEALANAGIRKQSFRETRMTDKELEAALAESPVVIPPEWLNGEISELARRAENASRTGETFRLSMDTSEAFRLWCKVLESFVRSNQSLGSAKIPVNGYGFLRMRRMYDWVSKQRRKWITGMISDQKRAMLRMSGFEPPMVDESVVQQHQKSSADKNVVVNVPEAWISGEFSDLAARAERATLSGEIFRTSADANTSFKLWCGILRSFINANPGWKGPVPGNGYGFLRSKRMYDWVCKQRKKCMDGVMPAEKLALLRASGFIVECPEPIQTPPHKKQKLLSPKTGVSCEVSQADLRDSQVTVPESWTTGDLKELAQRAEETAVKGEILKVAPDPANSFNIWCHVYKTFLDANPERGERVPGIGYGFLKNRRLYDWVKAQQRKITQGDLPESKKTVLRDLGFKVPATDSDSPDTKMTDVIQDPERKVSDEEISSHLSPPRDPDVMGALALPTEILIPESWIAPGRIGELARSAEDSLANRTMFRVDFVTWCQIYKTFNESNPEWCKMGLVPRKGAGFLKGARLYEWLRNQRKLVGSKSLPDAKRQMLEECKFREAPVSVMKPNSGNGPTSTAGMKYKTISLVAPEDVTVPPSWFNGTLAKYAKKAEDSSRVRKQFRVYNTEAQMFELWVEVLGSYIASNPNFERDGIPIAGPGFLRSRRLHDFAKTQYKLWFKKELSGDREALLRGVGFTF